MWLMFFLADVSDIPSCPSPFEELSILHRFPDDRPLRARVFQKIKLYIHSAEAQRNPHQATIAIQAFGHLEAVEEAEYLAKNLDTQIPRLSGHRDQKWPFAFAVRRIGRPAIEKVLDYVAGHDVSESYLDRAIGVMWREPVEEYLQRALPEIERARLLRLLKHFRD